MASTERFVIFYGKYDRPYIHPDHAMTRSEAVEHIAGDCRHLNKVVGFDVDAGTSRDATNEIVAEVVERWADQGEAISFNQYEFVEAFAGIQVARAFQLEDEYA